MSCKEETRKQIEQILSKKPFQTKTSFYKSVDHGFAIRAQKDDPIAVEARHNCFEETVKWFRENFQ